MTSELRFDNQVAVITGAGGGLGKQYALLLASRGARIVVNDLGGSVTGDGTDGEAANAAAAEIRDLGGEAVADSHSVTSPEGGQAIVDTALNAWGRVDMVINNAGIVGDAPFEDMTAERLEPLLDVHLRGAFYVTGPAWKVMREQGYGRILNTCSAAGILGAAGMSNYGSAKTGLIGLTACWRPKVPSTTSRSMPSPRSPTPGCWRTPWTVPRRRTIPPHRRCSMTL